jgi:hypothetical protein
MIADTDHTPTLHTPGWQMERENVKRRIKSVYVECSCGWKTDLCWWRSHAEGEYARHWKAEERNKERARRERLGIKP